MSEHEGDLFTKPFLTRTAIILLHILGLGPKINLQSQDDESSRTMKEPLWGQALRAKYYDEGKKWGRAEFDKVMAGYDAVLDTPCCFFAEELTAAYPDALVILNARPVDSWLRSMRSTIFAVHAWPSWKYLQYIDPKITGMWYPNRRLEWKIFCNHDYGEPCREAFVKHYDHVRKVVPKQRLLEYELGSGWEPLCRFLGKEVPEGEFPRVNDAEGFLMRQGWLWWYGLLMALVNVVKVGAPGLVVAAASLWYMNSQS
ncbi:MAG: hypothetical protein LQ346_008960 [Caloplaca aetnensis]|nr:MAG: hypothetical protein LQ346_008960 [Caloplaca aetnensis]